MRTASIIVSATLGLALVTGTARADHDRDVAYFVGGALLGAALADLAHDRHAVVRYEIHRHDRLGHFRYRHHRHDLRHRAYRHDRHFHGHRHAPRRWRGRGPVRIHH